MYFFENTLSAPSLSGCLTPRGGFQPTTQIRIAMHSLLSQKTVWAEGSIF
jgi:hypothetical protein